MFHPIQPGTLTTLDFWFLGPRDPLNRIREVQLYILEVVPRPFDPPEGWNLTPDGIYFLRGGGILPVTRTIRVQELQERSGTIKSITRMIRSSSRTTFMRV